MPNGRNAGRLFADCSGEYGYGSSHAIGLPNGDPLPKDRPSKPLEVKCHSTCKKDFLLLGDLLLEQGALSELATQEIHEPGAS